jgi:ferrous iron transport protein A
MAFAVPIAPVMILGLLSAGQTAVVDSVVGFSDEVHRLREIGLRDGATVQMIRPGNPCLVRLGGQKLGLRSDALASVLVRPEYEA